MHCQYIVLHEHTLYKYLLDNIMPVINLNTYTINTIIIIPIIDNNNNNNDNIVNNNTSSPLSHNVANRDTNYLSLSRV